MFLQKIKEFKLYIVIFLISLLLVLFVRTFWIQSYTVSSSQMETALLKGDKVLVNKIAYGLRMPMTLLSIPFTFDTFLGFKSYSTSIELKYHRLFPENVTRNDIVLFNNPLEYNKPLDKRSLILSRCAAVAGDTIKVKGADFFINGQKYSSSPDLLMSFSFETKNRDTIMFVMSFLDIPTRGLKQDSIRTSISLNKYEVFIINQKLSEKDKIVLDEKALLDYSLVIPSKGDFINLSPFNVDLFGDIILQELADEDGVILQSNQLLRNGIPIECYEFKNNYYWFISDNFNESIDSRYLGFISERCVIGKASFIWYSSSSDGSIWNRFLSAIK